MVGRHLIQNEAALDLVKVNRDCIFDKAIVKKIHISKEMHKNFTCTMTKEQTTSTSVEVL